MRVTRDTATCASITGTPHRIVIAHFMHNRAPSAVVQLTSGAIMCRGDGVGVPHASRWAVLVIAGACYRWMW